MKTPVGTLLAIDSVHIFSVVAPFVYEVVKETEKSVEITPLNEDGSYRNRENTRTIRKTTIVKILDKIEDFKEFSEMNSELKELYDAYSEKKAKMEFEVKKIKNLQKNQPAN